jgi:hypothetical protein
VDDQHRPRLRPKRARVLALYTTPPEEATVVCADELGPVIPRSFPPAPGWSADGHRVKAVLDYGRGPEKTWVYGALRPGDGQAVTLTNPSRNSAGYQRLLAAVEAANPAGTIMVITDNLSSHSSVSTRAWLVDHPRIQHAFIPTGACWLNLQEGCGGCFAVRRLPDSRSRTPRRSPWRPGWRPASSTLAPARGSGAARPHPHGTGGDSLCITFEERSTNGSLLVQGGR